MSDIDVYPVGVLSDLLYVRSAFRQRLGRRDALRRLRREPRYIWYQARRRNWRAIKNSFNGYLAEHRTDGTRCGHAWTKNRALRDLERHLASFRTETPA